MADVLPGFDAVPAPTNHNSFSTDQRQGFSNCMYYPVAGTTTSDASVPSYEIQAATTFQPVTLFGPVPGSLSSAPEESSKTVYHSMTGPELLPWPINRTMDLATARRLMTPLYVDTSTDSDYLSPYPQTAGGGLLKIVTDVRPTHPGGNILAKTVMGEVQLRGHGNEVQVSLQQNLPAKTTIHRPTCCPTLAVAPITNRGIRGMKRPASSVEPSLNTNWSLLKRRKVRTTFSKEQVDLLESRFQTNMYQNATERRQLAQQLELQDVQVKTWFQNRRMRWKRQHPDQHIASARQSTPSRPRTQVVKPLLCPGPPAAQQGEFVVPTPPPSVTVSTPSVVATGQSGYSGVHGELSRYPILPPSPVYNHGVAPSAGLHDKYCPAQAVYGASLFPHFPTGFVMHPWKSTNAIGPHGGVQYPPRHM